MLPTKIPFSGLSAAEIAELGNIGATTISAAQWGYLGACGTGGGQLLAALTTAESTQVEAIGTTTISAAQWGYLGACGAGGGQLLAALTTGESDQLELIGATTISAPQWGYLGALTSEPVEGDGTAGRILRGMYLRIKNGTNAATLKCSTADRWNGDTIGETDNVAKGATTGNFSLDGDGNILTIEASGLTGNAIYVFGSIISNGTGTEVVVNTVTTANDITIYTTASPGGGALLDLTTLVDPGNIYVELFYITDA